MRALAAALVLSVIGCNALIGLDDGQPTSGAGGGATSTPASASASTSAASAQSSSSSGSPCGSESSCEKQLVGWLGPLVLMGGQMPCPPTTAGIGADVVLVDEIDMPSCACTCAPGSKSCNAKIRFSQSAGCGGLIGTLNVQGGGGCHSLPGIMGGGVSVDVSSNPQCNNAVDATPPPLVTRTACIATGDSCGDSGGPSTCVPRPPGTRVCVQATDPAKKPTCPLDYPNKVTAIAADTVKDGRACTSVGACSCQPTQTPDCSGDVKVYLDNGCGLVIADVTIPASGHSNCSDLMGVGPMSATYDPVTLGTCTPSGKESPTGAVTGTTTDLCCHD